MSNNEFNFEQTNAMREAIEIVVRHLGGSEDNKQRTEVAKFVLSIAFNRRRYSAESLANLALEQLGEPSRKTA
jgi:hypothetical protein